MLALSALSSTSCVIVFMMLLSIQLVCGGNTCFYDLHGSDNDNFEFTTDPRVMLDVNCLENQTELFWSAGNLRDDVVSLFVDYYCSSNNQNSFGDPVNLYSTSNPSSNDPETAIHIDPTSSLKGSSSSVECRYFGCYYDFEVYYLFNTVTCTFTTTSSMPTTSPSVMIHSTSSLPHSSNTISSNSAGSNTSPIHVSTATVTVAEVCSTVSSVRGSSTIATSTPVITSNSPESRGHVTSAWIITVCVATGFILLGTLIILLVIVLGRHYLRHVEIGTKVPLKVIPHINDDPFDPNFDPVSIRFQPRAVSDYSIITRLDDFGDSRVTVNHDSLSSSRSSSSLESIPMTLSYVQFSDNLYQKVADFIDLEQLALVNRETQDIGEERHKEHILVAPGQCQFINVDGSDYVELCPKEGSNVLITCKCEMSGDSHSNSCQGSCRRDTIDTLVSDSKNTSNHSMQEHSQSCPQILTTHQEHCNATNLRTSLVEDSKQTPKEANSDVHISMDNQVCLDSDSGFNTQGEDLDNNSTDYMYCTNSSDEHLGMNGVSTTTLTIPENS